MKIEVGDARLDKDVSRNSFTPSGVMLLGTTISHTPSLRRRKRQIIVLTRAMLALCKPLKKCTGRGFEITLEGKAWRCFQRVISYCCDISEAEGMSSTLQASGKSHSCVRCNNTFENMVRGRKRTS